VSWEGRARTTAPENEGDGEQPSGNNSSSFPIKPDAEASPSGGWRVTYYVMEVPLW